MARWGRGLVWAGGTLLVLILVQGIHIPTFGVVEHMDPQYGGSYWQISLWPLVKVWGDTNNGYVLDAAVGVVSYLVVPLIAFLLASCFWRALREGPLDAATGRQV